MGGERGWRFGRTVRDRWVSRGCRVRVVPPVARLTWMGPDSDDLDMSPMDAMRVAPGTARQFEAGADGLQLLIFGSHVEGDVEQVPDFWAG